MPLITRVRKQMLSLSWAYSGAQAQSQQQIDNGTKEGLWKGESKEGEELRVITANPFDSTRDILFFCLELGIFMGSLAVVTLRKVVYSALSLGFVFVCIALVYLLLDADFLAAAQVLIYVGAINVLILFAIMLVASPDANTHVLWGAGEAASAWMATVLFGLLLKMISTTSWSTVNASLLQAEAAARPSTSTVRSIGLHLLTDSLLAFELLSLLLLVALVGAIMIARRDTTIG